MEDPQELLDKANAKVKYRRSVARVWRWLMGYCLECGNQMHIYWGELGNMKRCSVYPNHKSYATRLMFIFRPLFFIVLIVSAIAVKNCGKSADKAPRLGENSKETYIVPYHNVR